MKVHFNIYTMTKRKRHNDKNIAREENKRNLMDNRVLFSHLLKENNVATFQELLAEHPEYIQMHCSAVDEIKVSF